MRNNSSRRAAAPAPKRTTTIRTAAAGVAALACLTAAACSSSGSSSGKSSSSANPLAPSRHRRRRRGLGELPENELLGQIYADALQGKGVKVTTKFNIGAREVYYPQVVKGAITIIPEYNGALLTTSVDKTSTAASTEDGQRGAEGQAASSVEILNSSPAQDKDSVTVTQATATKYHLKSIADLTPVAKDFVIGGPPEFKTRADGPRRPEEDLRPDLQVLPAAGRVRADHDHRAAERQGPGRGPVHHHAADHHRPLRLARRPEEHLRRAERDAAGVHEGRQLHHREHAQRGVRGADHGGPAADEQGPDHRPRQLHRGGQRVPRPGGPEVTRRERD